MSRFLFHAGVCPLSDAVKQGTATRDDIDKTLKLGMNHPMGPLQLGIYTLNFFDPHNMLT